MTITNANATYPLDSSPGHGRVGGTMTESSRIDNALYIVNRPNKRIREDGSVDLSPFPGPKWIDVGRAEKGGIGTMTEQAQDFDPVSVRGAGLVSEVTLKQTQTGRTMAFVKLRGKTDFTAILFPNTYELYREFIQLGDKLFVSGYLETNNHVLVDSMAPELKAKND